MIAALARAGGAFEDPPLLDAAVRAADFVLQRLVDANGWLLHRYRDGEAAIPAFADDYLLLVWGLLELYEATFQVRWLREAVRFLDEALARFWDADLGRILSDRARRARWPGQPHQANRRQRHSFRQFRCRARPHEACRDNGPGEVPRPGGIRHCPLSAGGGIERIVLFVLSLSPRLLCGPDFPGAYIAGDPDDPQTLEMVRALRGRYLPNASVVLRPTNEAEPEIVSIAP